MGEQRTVAGCSVLREAPARESNRYKVVICQLPDVKEGEARYVVWYIDREDRPSGAKFFKARAAAQAEFERRRT